MLEEHYSSDMDFYSQNMVIFHYLLGGGQKYIPSEIYNSFVSSIINQEANLIKGEKKVFLLFNDFSGLPWSITIYLKTQEKETI